MSRNEYSLGKVGLRLKAMSLHPRQIAKYRLSRSKGPNRFIFSQLQNVFLRPLCVQLVVDTTAFDDPPQAEISIQYLGARDSRRRP